MQESGAKMNARTWWRAGRQFSVAELVADGIVHGIGIFAAIGFGSALLALAIVKTAPNQVPALAIYVGTLIAVLSVSLAYNLWPISPVKKILARFDQAAIFLFIAGTYTPFLAIMWGTTAGTVMMSVVWGAAIIGVALKLIIPQHFGRLAFALYLAIGWSGIFVFGRLAATLPPVTLWLIVAGGALYSIGIVFHLWEKLRFQNVVWHTFVVAAAMAHMVAIFEFMVLARL